MLNKGGTHDGRVDTTRGESYL